MKKISSSQLYEQPWFHYALFALVIVAIIVSSSALMSVNELKAAVTPETIEVDKFLEKLTNNEEMKQFVGVAPLNIIEVNQNNLANLQAQITGLDDSYIGTFIVQYTNAIVMYDYAKDEVRGTVSLQQPEQAQLPSDFFDKMNKHPELQGLQDQQPIGGQLDASTLETLMQQFPDVYANAQVGQFLLRYETRLIVYDYDADQIITAVNLD